MNLPHALKVLISTRESVCDECRQTLGDGAWIALRDDRGALCLSCADIELVGGALVAVMRSTCTILMRDGEERVGPNNLHLRPPAIA